MADSDHPSRPCALEEMRGMLQGKASLDAPHQPLKRPFRTTGRKVTKKETLCKHDNKER